jgi:hypothetical protein
MTSIEQLHVQSFSRIKKNAKFGAILPENTVSFCRYFFHDKNTVLLRIFFHDIGIFWQEDGRKRLFSW